MKIFRFLSLLSFVLVLLPQPAISSPRTALVVGNSAYQFSPLTNPANDAMAMAKSLRGMGFDVAEHTDLDRKGMRQAIRDFGKKLRKGGVGLFFYAGHGIQIKGRNYLIPVGVDITSSDEVQDEAIDAGTVLRKMDSAGNDVNIVIMDACRNNPFARSFRSVEQGLARMEGPVGSIIAYATAPGSTAADGDGENGLYTSYLLEAMQQPGLSIEEVFKQVRINVRDVSEGKQIPWESSSMTGNFQFVPGDDAAKTTTVATIPPPPSSKVLTQTGHLQVTSNIVGAKVFVNNIERGVIGRSRTLNLQNFIENKVEVRLERSGFQSQTKNVQLQKGEWRDAYFELLPQKTAFAPAQLVSPNTAINPVIDPVLSGNKPEDSQNTSNTKRFMSENSDEFNFAPGIKSSGIISTDILPSSQFSLPNNRTLEPSSNTPTINFSNINDE